MLIVVIVCNKTIGFVNNSRALLDHFSLKNRDYVLLFITVVQKEKA